MLVQPIHRSGIYLRISDDREGRELGVGRQQEDCLSLAKRLGCEFYDIYKDNDISASTRSRKVRPQYQRLLADARAGAIDTIIAYTSGRLTRRPRENEDQIDLAEHYGVRFMYVASPSFDLNTAAGRRVARILAASDAGEPEDISERVMRDKLASAVKGQYMGGARAYGFEGPIKENGIIVNRGRINVVVIEGEKAVWCGCASRIMAGEGEMAIIRDLNHRDIPSPGGKQWQATRLKRLLSNKRYVVFDPTGHPRDCPCLHNPEGNGTLVHRGIEHRALWPGFITADVYQRLLTAFSQAGRHWGSDLVRGRTYLTTGFTYCGRCGAPMAGQRRKTSTGKSQRRYRCYCIDKLGDQVGCGKVFRDANALEEFVTEAVFARFDSPEVARALAPKEDEERVQELSQRLAEQKAHRQRLVIEYGRGEHDKADYKIMLAAADESIEAAQVELAKLQVSTATGSVPAAGVLREVWETSSIDWRRNVIRLLVERIVVHPAKSSAYVSWNGHRFNPDDVTIEWRVKVPDAAVIAALQVLVQGVRRTHALRAH